MDPETWRHRPGAQHLWEVGNQAEGSLEEQVNLEEGSQKIVEDVSEPQDTVKKLPYLFTCLPLKLDYL